MQNGRKKQNRVQTCDKKKTNLSNNKTQQKRNYDYQKKRATNYRFQYQETNYVNQPFEFFNQFFLSRFLS